MPALKSVPYLKCFIIPGLIGSGLMCVILSFLGVSIFGHSTVNKCKTIHGDQNCEPTKVSNKGNIFWYLFCVPLCGFIIGSIVYQMCFSYYNPGYRPKVVVRNVLKPRRIIRRPAIKVRRPAIKRPGITFRF